MSVIFFDKDGVKTFTDKGELKVLSGFKHVMELPEGDWIMRLCRDTVILADRSGKNPPYAVDKEGNWTKLEPIKTNEEEEAND